MARQNSSSHARDMVLYFISIFVTVAAAIITLTPQDLSARLHIWGGAVTVHAHIIATGALLVIAIVYFVLYTHATRYHKCTPRVMMSLFAARQVINRILADYARGKKTRRIRILASSGGSVFPIIKEQLLNHAALSDLTIEILLIDWDMDIFDSAASHWRHEAKVTAGRIAVLARDVADRRINIVTRRYHSLPVMHGLLFDDEHLLFGLFQWIHRDGGEQELVGAEVPYIHVTRRMKEAHLFHGAFASWFDQLWSSASAGHV